MMKRPLNRSQYYAIDHNLEKFQDNFTPRKPWSVDKSSTQTATVDGDSMNIEAAQ